MLPLLAPLFYLGVGNGSAVLVCGGGGVYVHSCSKVLCCVVWFGDTVICTEFCSVVYVWCLPAL